MALCGQERIVGQLLVCLATVQIHHLMFYAYYDSKNWHIDDPVSFPLQQVTPIGMGCPFAR